MPSPAPRRIDRRGVAVTIALALTFVAGACGKPTVHSGDDPIPQGSEPDTSTPSTTPSTLAVTTTAPQTSLGSFGADSGRPLRVISGNVSAELEASAIATAPGLIFVGTAQGGVYVFDDQANLVISAPTAHAGTAVVGLGATAEGGVISCGANGTVLVWRSAQSLQNPTDSGPMNGIALSAAATSDDGEYVALSGINGRVAVFATADLTTPVVDVRVQGRATSLDFATPTDGADVPPPLAIGTASGTVSVIRSTNEVEPLGVADSKPVTSVAFVDGDGAIISSGSELPKRFDVETGAVTLYGPVGSSGDPITALAAWAPAGAVSSRFATGGTDPRPDPADPSASAAPTSGVTAATTEPTGVPSVRLWLSDNDAPADRPARGFVGTVEHLAFLVDGSGLVIADSRRVRLRSLDT